MVFDILIKGGFVVDGTGNPWYRADIGIDSGKIVRIDRAINENAKKVIDAKGKVP